MSKTLYVEYRDDGFWAYDVGVGIFCKYLIDAAELRIAQANALWLVPCVERWRVNATISDYGLHLDEDWSDAERQTVQVMIDEVCNRLRTRASIPQEEMDGWNILDGQEVFSRGAAWFPTAPVVELARAVQALLSGNLLPAPKSRWWLYGTEEGRSTLKKGIE